jgi:hypothetical protein
MTRFTIKLIAGFILVAAGFSATAEDLKPQILSAGQVAKLDLNGKWSGKRMQYTADKKAFAETFQYEFNLKQEGNIVTGTSTILDANGNFADMNLEGVVVGNKLIFREYAVQNAIRPEGKIWCFKSGELNFSKDGDNISLVGATSSYMEIYNYPCTGGVTNLTKVDNNSNIEALSAMTTSTVGGLAENKINIEAYPNPFVDNANISYTLNKDAKVTVEIFDMQGKLITSFFEGSQKAGGYNFNFNARNFSSGSGIYIVKLMVDADVYSSQMVQMR